ncbi:hypothetical protein BMF94_4330 [Rhodotorula taiwanensis]|uniref:Uncharacterized protein n=1 Tax=Rhodotorula taiwanensis TaxID=741276 RepID=A0A2S5B6U3_9BASI|nr:hypothetical protein BMF94_4330 [Rhodotorula taiwanensis]
MAKSTAPTDEGKPWFRLVVTVAVLAGLAYMIRLVVKAINEGVDSAKGTLQQKGVNVSTTGASIRTDKRAVTQEELGDQMQRGLMKGWKASTFNVPWALTKTTHLGGSRHDKNKEEWEKANGPKQYKNRVD